MKDRNTPGEDNHAAQVGCWGLVVGKLPRGDRPVSDSTVCPEPSAREPDAGLRAGGQLEGNTHRLCGQASCGHSR